MRWEGSPMVSAAPDQDRSGAAGEEPEEGFEGGGASGAVATEQRHDLAFAD